MEEKSLVERMRKLAADHDKYEQGGGASALLNEGADALAMMQRQAAAQAAEIARLRETLQGIAEADPRTWEELAEPIGEFARWAKSRAAHALLGAP